MKKEKKLAYMQEAKEDKILNHFFIVSCFTFSVSCFTGSYKKSYFVDGIFKLLSMKNIKNKIAIQLGKSIRSSNSSQKQPFTDVLQNI